MSRHDVHFSDTKPKHEPGGVDASGAHSVTNHHIS